MAIGNKGYSTMMSEAAAAVKAGADFIRSKSLLANKVVITGAIAKG